MAGDNRIETRIAQGQFDARTAGCLPFVVAGTYLDTFQITYTAYYIRLTLYNSPRRVYGI